MKLDPHLPQLPSIGELLEHPRVKGVVARINRSTIAQRATGFLEELRSSLATKAGGEAPSLAHLAERLARRLLGEPVVAGSVINATGVVLGEPELAPPLPERSLHAIFQLASEYHRDDAPAHQPLERDVAILVGAEAALAVRSFEAALTLASPPTIATTIVRRADTDISLSALAAAATQPTPCLIDAAPLAGVIDPATYGYQTVETIPQRLAAGADLVIVDGAGLLGGPSCGLIVGRRRIVDAISNHPQSSLAAIDRLSAAALAAVVQAYRDDAASQVVFQLPVWQLLSAPLDNLRQRAERLAPQMAESPAVAAAECRQVDSVWRRQEGREWRAASWAIFLTPKSGDCDRLRTELARPPYPILARVVDDAVAIDLRSTFPRWDQQLVAAVVAVAG